MAHFAELDENNIVLRVVVIDNKDTADVNGVEKEHIGSAFCEKLFGGTWKQTSYNANIRKNYAGTGFKYHEDIDAFMPPKPEGNPSFVIDAELGRWVPPIAMPDDAPEGQQYIWIEEDLAWILVDIPEDPEIPAGNSD